MTQTLLDQLKTMTVTVADTGDIHSIEKYKPRDTTTGARVVLMGPSGMPRNVPSHLDGTVVGATLALDRPGVPLPIGDLEDVAE